MLDSMASPHPVRVVDNTLADAFRFYLVEGIDAGQIEVWGVPKNGSVERRINQADTHHEAFSDQGGGGDLPVMMDGVYYHKLRIRRSSLRSYVDHIEKHDAELLRRAKKGLPLRQTR